MASRSLHIAWLGAGPGKRETGGVPGVATELIRGLAELGHRVDCYLPASGRALPPRLDGVENVTYVWGTGEWYWNRWYSRVPVAARASGLIARSLASLRLRREVARRHGRDPYDVIYQFSSIETLSMPSQLRDTVPLVIHPETHIAGELTALMAERRLSLRFQPRYAFVVTTTIMRLRARVQRRAIRRASLVVCISEVFRDHLVSDYGVPLTRTIVIPNPIRIDRFVVADRALNDPPVILVLGRVAVRKGLEDVVAVARTLLERGVDARIRVVGGPDLASDYTALLEELPRENAEYAGPVSPLEVPTELARSDLLLQASKYEPFALTVAEALAAGVPIVATDQVGAVERVSRSVVGVVEPGDVDGLATAISAMLEHAKASPAETRATARAEAERLFASEVVCKDVSEALEGLLGSTVDVSRPSDGGAGHARQPGHSGRLF